MIISVFTEKYKTIQRKLINSAVVEFNGQFIPVKAQWDTGATGTCISKEIVTQLGLQPTGMIKVQTPSGIGTMNKYMVNLILNNEVRIMNLVVMDSEIGNQGIDVLIGMDIISVGDFAVSNFNGKTQFSFRMPSQEHVEYHR
ncbi:MAG: retroviral-like aspartic protease family protein [Lachnoclostridium sp.]|nr:retroviral-like aspartic protease family protein [Lachnospira sp.]MCM1247630.1 retroviral-like aspartic protease family protein [Lachnoclostridium sp.]